VRRATVVLILAGLAGACGGAAPTASPTTPAAPPPPTVLAWRWRALTPATGLSPEPRAHGVAVYDAPGRRLVVFGGQGDRALFNDTWAFDLARSTWARLDTRGVPPDPRLGADAVFDPVGRRMIVWAGQAGSHFFDDTWALDLATLEWRDVSPDARPQARYGSASVFDPAQRRLVQFAGFTDLSRRFRDTQAFDLATHRWEDLTPPDGGPRVRCLLTAALHAPSRRMIAYGGQNNGYLDDLWAFDLATRTWTDLTVPMRPPGRLLASSFVTRDGVFMVFGGRTEIGQVNETWAFDLSRGQWSLLAVTNTPPGRDSAMTAYVDAEERFLVFGGRQAGPMNDVWELARVAVPAAVP
jgi:hypothetical protein